MRHYDEIIDLQRDVAAIEIPAGRKTVLPKGEKAIITQSLGGAYTIQTVGGMFRIDEQDADALGKAVPEKPDVATIHAGDLEAQVTEVLKTCYDPEIPINIVDLGLVYGVRLGDHPEGGKVVVVDFTLTAPGCGMGEVLRVDMERKIRDLPGVRDVHLNLIFDPPWDRSRLSPAAAMALGF